MVEFNPIVNIEPEKGKIYKVVGTIPGQELEEKIGHILYECDTLAISYHTAKDQLIALFKEALPEYALLAKDQSLPEIVFTARNDDPRYIDGIVRSSKKEAQQDMLKQGWRKVILEEKDDC